nr:integrase, catalytic region, zinc finger, CCHC-type, peptidase aspartic, catalytic [Tanacetum cinerariifolium]
MKDKLSAHQETISILSKQKEAQLKLYKTREDKELGKVIELENKVKVLDNIVYKTGQSVQTMNMLNNKCQTRFEKPKFLKKAQRANPRLYDIGCYNDNLALMLTPDSDEVIRLEKESRSKLSDLIRPFDYDKLNNLYDLFVPQREKSSEQLYFSERSRLSHININNGKSKESFNKQTTLLEKRMDESIPLDKQCQSSLEIFKVKSNVNTIITGVELCKQKIAKRTYISYIDPFIQSTIESNFCPIISRICAGLNQFLREYYYADHINAILGVYTELDEVTNLQCDYLELLEKCEGLETELSKSKMILNAKTLTKKSVSDMCDKCVLIDKHDMSVLNPVTKPIKRTVTSESNKNLRNFTMKLYEHKTQFLNEIDRLSREYYYADHMNAILGVYTELDEVTNLQCDYLELLEKYECIETELLKSKMMSQSFESVQKHAINLELELQQCKEKIKNYMLFKVNQTKYFCKERKQYFEIQNLKAQLQDKGIVINFSKSKSVTQNNVSNDFSKPVTAQTLPPNKKSILKNTSVLAPGMYKLHTESNQTRTSQLPQDSRKTNKRMSFSTGVIPTTSVSRPQLKSNPMGDRVMRNSSQGKKQEVEDQRRSVKLSKNKTSVTACNDILNAKTLNVNSMRATCDKCMLHDKHGVPLCQILYYLLILLHLVKIVLFIVDSGCSKNDQIAPILGYGDLVQGAVTIKRVYYVEGLNHNLFFVGQFCDADLEVAFRKSTCFIRDLKGNDILTGSRGTDLYSITLQDTNCPNPICLMAKATSSQAWLWHRRLSHLNFDTINLLSKNDIVVGLPKLKFIKDHLCSS